MPLSDEIVKNARAKSSKAVVVIGRAAGEDRENKLEKVASSYTTKKWKCLIRLLNTLTISSFL
jgi:beta-glucosidase